MKINTKVLYKLTVSFLLIIARHVQSIQNSTFVIFHFIKERRDEVDFLHADKHQTFLQLDTIKYYCAQITQNNKFAESLWYLKKETRDEVDYLCKWASQLYKGILSFLMGMERHAQSTQNKKYPVSLQYLKKELSYEVDVLHADKHGGLLQVVTFIFDRFGPACPKYPGKFADILRKKLEKKLGT